MVCSAMSVCGWFRAHMANTNCHLLIRSRNPYLLCRGSHHHWGRQGGGGDLRWIALLVPRLHRRSKIA